MSLLSRLQVLSEVLGCDKVPNKLAPAAYVLGIGPRTPEQLWDDAESWYMDYDHTPKAKEVQS